MDLTKALAPKSDQLDFADLEGSAPQIFTISKVAENGSELADQQPVNITLEEFPRVWRPAKSMLRVLADNWGKDVSVWIGRRVELYGDPNVYFGKEKRGGTRISRLSHIRSRKSTLVNPRGGKGAYWSVEPLPDAPTPPKPDPNLLDTSSPLAKQMYAAIKASDIPQAEVMVWISNVIGRDVDETKQMTPDEARQVIAALGGGAA